jgi:Arc/MetJ-type ribon-helix-helix transcriptional regulator
MTTITVPLTTELALIIDTFIERGIATNKADLMRRALVKFAEDQAVLDVLLSEQEAREGKVLHGDLRDLAKKLGV